MKNKIFIIGIVIIAMFLRFNNLVSIPPSASLDEASIGYNAHSILKTGGDEYGTKLPILLRAYDDWRPALYVYLVIPFIKLFGLNVLSVRLPSVLLSIATIFATYFLVKEIFGNKILALLSSSLLAISPWHIYISRLGHEANAGLSFAVFAILFFTKAINSKKILFLILSSIFFGLSLYTYQSEKIFIPLMILVLGFIYKDNLLKMKRGLGASIILGIIIIIPITLTTLSPQALIRFKGTSAFMNNSFYEDSAKKILKYKNEGNIFGEIINNRRLVPLKIFAMNYFSHFNPKFLFSNSGDESFKAPNFGLMYIWEFPFLFIGSFYLLVMRNEKIKSLLISWLLISFIAPSLTTGAPHAMRAYNVLPVPQIFVAFGILKSIDFIGRKRKVYLIKLFYALIIVVVMFFLRGFYREYFYKFPKNQSSSFQYSLYKSISYTNNSENSYKKIIFSNEDSLYQSYMFYLFYSKYDPALYQKQGGTKSGGFEEEHKFDKYEFRPIVWHKDKFTKSTLFIGNASDFPESLDFQKHFTNIDGKGIIKVIGLK